MDTEKGRRELTFIEHPMCDNAELAITVSNIRVTYCVLGFYLLPTCVCAVCVNSSVKWVVGSSLGMGRIPSSGEVQRLVQHHGAGVCGGQDSGPADWL